jgi:hypothetical protein
MLHRQGFLFFSHASLVSLRSATIFSTAVVASSVASAIVGVGYFTCLHTGRPLLSEKKMLITVLGGG